MRLCLVTKVSIGSSSFPRYNYINDINYLSIYPRADEPIRRPHP